MDTNEETVYLCQIGPNVSCGSCCGLYNVADPSLELLDSMLTRRTKWFEKVPRTVEGLDGFKQKVEAAELQERPFPKFHHCPYLGMIEDAGRRVGCLLHPLAKGNKGVDFRGISYYGGMACRTYFCPSVKELPSRWLSAIRQSMDHWYLHGLIVTEKKLLASFFTELEKRLNRTVRGTDFSPDADTALLLRSFASLKLEWPYKKKEAHGPSNYFFEDGLYPRPTNIYQNDDWAPSRFEEIFVELDSVFSSQEDVETADAKIESIIAQLVNILSD